MDVLVPWIVAAIERELSEALRHWGKGTNDYQPIGKSRGLPYDDGSNLRIPSEKEGPVVQITKFLTFQDPIQVTLSDSVIRVNASIANQASQRYAKENKRRLTHGTLGGLIQLLEFEIVATHFGPRDKRLTLYVKDFKSLDSGGSGNFGAAPQAIESREGTRALLNKLADLRKHGSDAHSGQSAAESPMSQLSTQTSEPGNDQDSQIGFATQVPRSGAPILSKSKSLGSNTGVSIESTSTADSAKSLAHSMKTKHGNLLEGTLNPLQAKSAPERPNTTNRKVLLNLLRKHKPIPSTPEHNPDPTLRQSPGRVTAPNEHLTGERSQAFRVNGPAPSDANAVRSPIQVQKRKRHSLESSPRKKNSNGRDLQEIRDDGEILAVEHALETTASSGVGVAEAFNDTLHSQPTSPSEITSTNDRPNASLEPSVLSTPRTTSPALAQKTIRNGISRRDVSIPKDQEILLNRADSWLPAEPGQREPSANIPISVLKKLNQKAAFHAEGPIKSRKQKNGTVSPRAVIDRTTDSESDAPISSEQWPASPEREQLPPDSSSASADHSDHSAHRILNTFRSASPTRRRSNASTSSHSIPSGPPSHISARPSLETSKPLDVMPSTASSPSFTSISAGEAHADSQHDGNSALSRRSGSATPTKIDASTPMSPGPKTWSGRGGGSGLKVPNVEANNELDSVEVSASMPLLLDGRWKSLGDEEIHRRHSSTESELRSKIPPNTPPAPIPLATTNSGGTYVAQQNIATPVPASPSSESDLELTVPLALNQTTDSCPGSAPLSPCTGSPPRDPFTQVKRTPYASNHVQSESLPMSMNIASPSKSRLHPRANNNVDDDTEFVSASVASEPGASTAETDSHTRDSHTIEDRMIGDMAAKCVEEINSQEVTDGNAKTPSKVISEKQQEPSRAGVVADEPDKTSMVRIESQRQNLQLNQPAVLQEASINISAVPGKLFTPESKHRQCLPQLSISDNAAELARGVKRKVADANFVSRDITKRQKRFKVPSGFIFNERSDVLRDPSERARQYRQDFLASRRSSESSNPTSPMAQFTALSTPLSNGTALVETDTDDAKPGAQDNAPSNHGADSPLVAMQNRNVKDPDAEPNSLIKASFCAPNDELQRARSVDLDVSVRSLDQGESADGLWNRNDEADPTVNIDVESNITGRNHFRHKHEGSRPVDSESDQVRKDLSSQADVVAQQETNALTPKAISDHVTEPDNAAPSVAVDDRTQMPDDITIESMSNQQLVGVDPDTSMTGVQVSQDMASLKIVAHSGMLIKQTIPLLPVGSPFVTDSKAEDQQKVSTTGSPTTPLSNPTPDSQTESVEKRGTPLQLAMESTKQEPLCVAQSIFDRFKATYPAYSGDMKHFVAICRKISQLVKMNRMEHQSLWDDFIVRHKVDYSQYLRRCAEEAEDAVPYEIFYQTQIEGPQYQKRIINRRNLDEALAPIARQPNHENAPAGNNDPLEPGKAKSATRHKPAASYKNDQKPSESRVVIDLTEDDPPDDTPKRAKEREIAPRSSLLHLVNGVSAEPPSSQHCQDRLSSLDQAPSISTTMRGSHVPPSTQSIRPPPMSAPSSIKNATKSLRRSLPWKGSDKDFLQSSSKGKASDSLRELPASGLRDIRAKRINHATSNMSTTSLFTQPHTNTAAEKQNEGTPVQWWDDNNSPFKSFARAYASIRPGNGNSFAPADSAESADGQKAEDNLGRGVQLKKINIVRWSL